MCALDGGGYPLAAASRIESASLRASAGSWSVQPQICRAHDTEIRA
ncbi:MAG TPA: hypothetical protein VN695_07840 [Streptosporangiaceae bacterium]|nr:hypothetical protein [Streptosporangiaceae bacterium]